MGKVSPKATKGLRLEDIIAVRVRLSSGSARYFLTLGRIFDPVDATKTLDIVARYADRYDLGGRPSLVELCQSLQEACREPYFFEALFRLAQHRIPYGPTYRAWQRRVAAQMKRGEHLHYLGRRRRAVVSKAATS